MSFINVNLDDVQEQKPAATGIYPLQIVKCDVAKTGDNSKTPGAPQFKVSLGFTDNPDTPNILHYVPVPQSADDSFKALLLKRFLTHFNVSVGNDGFDLEQVAMELVGAVANCEVGLTEPNSNGDVYNNIKIPKLPNEAQSGRMRPPGR